MSDLVRRLVGKTWYVVDSSGKRWADDAPIDAAREILRLRRALAKIEGADSWIDASIRSDGPDRKVMHGALGAMARDALEQNATETATSEQESEKHRLFREGLAQPFEK